MKPTVLIVDDEKHTRDGLRAALEAGDQPCLEVALPREAREGEDIEARGLGLHHEVGDDHIEAAVEEGRGVFDNLTKFIVWTLPTNTGEAMVLLTAILFGTVLPALPGAISDTQNDANGLSLTRYVHVAAGPRRPILARSIRPPSARSFPNASTTSSRSPSIIDA